MIKEKLIAAGVDYDQGVHRFGDKQALYEKYLLKFFDENQIDELRMQLESGDYAAAFRTAHNMKGESGNLSMTDLYGKICELVEKLRAGVRDESLSVLLEQAMERYDAVMNAAKENL